MLNEKLSLSTAKLCQLKCFLINKGRFEGIVKSLYMIKNKQTTKQNKKQKQKFKKYSSKYSTEA